MGGVVSTPRQVMRAERSLVPRHLPMNLGVHVYGQNYMRPEKEPLEKFGGNRAQDSYQVGHGMWPS